LRPVDVIFMTRHDTIDTACELLRRARPGAQVWMVVPWRARYARELLNLKRLRRIAGDKAVELRLVSRDARTRALAREAGVEVSAGMPRALKRLEPREIRSADFGARVVPVTERLSARHLRAPSRFNVGRAILGLAFIALLLVTMIGVIAVFLPSAEVALEPVSTREQVTFTAQANTRYDRVDLEMGLIPLKSVQVIVEGHAETPASGTADVAEGYASGFVVFTNRTNEAVVVPKGTVVRSGSGETMRFRTTEEVTLPASLFATARAPVEAVEAGYAMAGAYTLTRVEGALASRIEVMNDASVGGGGSRRVPIVTYADLDTLRAMLVEQLQGQAYDQLIEQLDAGEFVPANTLSVEVMSLDYDQYVNQQNDVLSGTMRLVVRGSAVNDRHLRQLARARIMAQAGGDVEIIEDTVEMEQMGDIRVEDAWVEIDMRAAAAVVPTVDYDDVRANTRGRTPEQAAEWLEANLELASAPRIEVKPEGWPRMPILDGRFVISLTSLP